MRPGRATAEDLSVIPITRPGLPPLSEYVALLERIWSSRMLSNFAEFATALEALATGYSGARYVLSVSSGDVALILALRALELPSQVPSAGAVVHLQFDRQRHSLERSDPGLCGYRSRDPEHGPGRRGRTGRRRGRDPGHARIWQSGSGR